MQNIKVTQLELKLNNLDVNQLVCALVILAGRHEEEGHEGASAETNRLLSKIVEQSKEQMKVGA